MNKYIVLIIALIAPLLHGCQSSSPKAKDPVVFVSILPLKYFADQITGDKYRVEVTVPPGAGPETYSPSSRQMVDMGKAKAYFSIGYLGFEQAWLENLEKGAKGLRVFSTAKDIVLIEEKGHHEGHVHLQGVDPHIWSSPKTAHQVARNIYEGMIAVDPDNEEYFQKNLSRLQSRIDSVDFVVTKLFKTSQVKKFVVFHPALGYLARDYGLEQLSIEFEGKVPSPKHLQEVVQQIDSSGLGVLLMQREFDKKNAEVIARETNCKIVQIDPLAYDWPSEMVNIAKTITGNSK